jgi:hypothetical protein
MFEEDSDSRYSFSRVEKKIRKMFPELKKKEEFNNHRKSKHVSSSGSSND